MRDRELFASSLRAAGGGRGGWCAAAVVLLVFAVALVASRPCGAEEDPFSVTIKVDATADNVIKAREAARLDGQRRALAALADRLSGAGSAAKLAKLDEKAITALVTSFEVANERMSAVRYIADYTFHFSPDGVRRVLGSAGLAVAEPGQEPRPAPAGEPSPPPRSQPSAAPGNPLIVIPVYQTAAGAVLWEDPNPWRDAWAQRPAGAAAVQLVLPLGDAGDIAIIDAEKARAGDREALAAIARQNGGDETIVLLAVARGAAEAPSGLDISVQRYRAGQPIDRHVETLTINPGESPEAVLNRAVATIAAEIETGWSREAPAPPDQPGSLTAVLPITSLDDWVRMRQRLAALPAVRNVTLVALSLQEATIQIDYVGGIDRLKAGLATANLDLVQNESLWRLARSGAAPQ
jgi:hypothetical protein